MLIAAAVEMWIFAVHLPLMIGHVIPEEDEMWQCFLLLLDILKVSTCRVQSPGFAGYLEVLITIVSSSVVTQEQVLYQSSIIASTFHLKLLSELLK